MNPPDPVIAAGPNHIVNVVNSAIAIYDKSGSQISQSTLSEWFSNVSTSEIIFDPKIAYDHYEGKWIVLALGAADENIKAAQVYYVSVSQSSDPTSLWNNYNLDATKNGEANSNTLADFPGLGYDQSAIYITSDQYDVSDVFHYSKIRVLNKTQLYAGLPVTWTDFWDMRDESGEQSKSIKPVRNFGDVSVEYLVNKSKSEMNGNYITLWKITDPLSPILKQESNIIISSYTPPILAEQNDNDALRYVLNVYSAGTITNAVFRDGFIYCGFTIAHDWGGGEVNAIRYLKINTITHLPEWVVLYGEDMISYMYPAINVDESGNVLMVYNKSGVNLYPGVYWTFRAFYDDEMRGDFVLIEGSGPIKGNAFQPSSTSSESMSPGEPTRFGDYNAVVIDPLNPHTFWFCGEYGRSDNKWNVRIGSFEFAPVTFTNEIGEQDAGGKLIVNDVLEVNSGESEGLIEYYYEHTVRPKDRKFIDWNSGVTDYQHHDWNNDRSYYEMNNKFYAYSGQVEKAKFNELDPSIIIKNYLSGGEGGEIQLKDPWFEEADGSQPNNPNPYDSPFTPGSGDDVSYSGLFLNQGDISNLQLPYYRVVAEDDPIIPVHDDVDVKWYFQGWEGDNVEFKYADQNETPVVFKAANAEARALYKGHMVSNQDRATGHNNGRRLARDGNGHLHLVYEDGGNIYYTKSENDGEDWTAELLIGAPSDESSRCAHPAISYFSDKLFAVWVEIYGEGSVFTYFKEYDLSESNPTWGNGDVLLLYSDVNMKEPMPSITVLNATDNSEYYPVMAVDCYENGSYYTYLFIGEYGDWFEMAPSPLNGKNPSLSADTYFEINNSMFALVWDDNEHVYIKTCAMDDNGSRSWGASYTVSQESVSGTNIEKPNVSFINNYAHVVWQGLNTTTNKREVYYRMMHPWEGAENTLSSYNGSVTPHQTVTTISSAYYNMTNPSVCAGAYYASSQEALVYYQRDNWIYKKKFVNQNLKGNYFYDSGKYPAVVEHTPESAIWSYYSEAPFFIKSDYAGPSSVVPIGPKFDPNWGALDMVLDPGQNGGQEGRIIIDFLDVTFGTDTMHFDQALRSDSISTNGEHIPLQQDLKVTFINVNQFPPDAEVIFNLNFIDGTDTLSLTTLAFGELPRSGERFFKLTTIVNLGVRDGHLAYTFGSRQPLVWRKLISTEDDPPMAKSGKYPPETKHPIIPQKFSLHQNYPNPFNPLTHITVDLPAEADVKLSVYNIKGQKVKDIWSGSYSAGIYEVFFDGSGLASGIYIYRLQAGEYVAQKRMLLMK